MRLFDDEELMIYYLKRNDVLQSTNSSFGMGLHVDEIHETALDIFPNSLFNQKANLLDESFVGFVMETTNEKITVFGDFEQRYDIPKLKAAEVNNNIVLDMEWNEFITYRVNCV